MKGRTFSLDAGRAEAGVEVVDVQGAVISTTPALRPSRLDSMVGKGVVSR